jgi:hypothetical protein
MLVLYVISNVLYTTSRFFGYLHPEGSDDRDDDDELDEEAEHDRRSQSVGGRLGLTAAGDRGPALTEMQQKDVSELKKLRSQLEKVNQIERDELNSAFLHVMRHLPEERRQILLGHWADNLSDWKEFTHKVRAATCKQQLVSSNL